MLGLTGAHRTGKTTLAKAFAEEVGIPFITSSASQVYQDLGLDVGDDHDFATRLAVQVEILNRAQAQYDEVKETFITDRTPVDFAAYMIADIMKAALTPEQDAAVMHYVDTCYKVTNTHFGRLVGIPPALPYIIEPGKPPPSLAYQQHIHLLTQGVLGDLRMRVPYSLMHWTTVNLDDRVAVLHDLMNAVVENFRRKMAAQLVH